MKIARKLQRMDMMDYIMYETVLLIIGIIIATYFSSLRGFVEQNILVVIFLIIVIGVRPIVKLLKK